MAGVWVFAELPGQTLELLSAGAELAVGLGVRLVALAQDEDEGRTYLEHGADEVFVLPSLSEGEPLESYVPVLARVAKEEDPDVVLIAATQRGKDIAARLAARLGTGFCSGCTGFALDPETKVLVMERLLFGGAAVQKVTSAARPQVASIPPRTFEPAPQRPDAGEAKLWHLDAEPSSAVQVIRRVPKARESVDITGAKVVVCVGRGVENAAGVELASELAEVLGGEVACSRPIAEELHWLSEDVYLGISGKKVKPQLYVGVGISGQIQHVTGIRGSKVIMAINRDENAPIFEAADYGIVGDLYQVVPVLVEELRKALK